MRLFITILVALLSISNVYSQNTCTFTANNQTYDLSFLNKTSDQPYTYKSDTGMSFVYNICGQAPFCISNTLDKGSSICSINSTAATPTYLSFGDYSRGGFVELPKTIDGVGAQLQYAGDPTLKCGGTGTRNTFLNLVCSDVKQPTVVSIIEPWNKGAACQLTLQVNIPCTPPKNSGLGGGWIFIIVLLCGSAAYILFGSVINWKIRDQKGADIFPNIEFWRSFGSHIKDGCGYIKNKVTGTPGEGYSNI